MGKESTKNISNNRRLTWFSLNSMKNTNLYKKTKKKRTKLILRTCNQTKKCGSTKFYHHKLKD